MPSRIKRQGQAGIRLGQAGRIKALLIPVITVTSVQTVSYVPIGASVAFYTVNCQQLLSTVL